MIFMLPAVRARLGGAPFLADVLLLNGFGVRFFLRRGRRAAFAVPPIAGCAGEY